MQRFHIGLRGGEKIYLNGAVIKVDRKVSIELLNDVTFLLESHIIQAEDTHTPLRQLYFVVQTMLIDPKCVAAVRSVFDNMYDEQIATFKDIEILEGLQKVKNAVHRDKNFDALKILRGMFDVEAKVLKIDDAKQESKVDSAKKDPMPQLQNVKEAV